METVTPAKMVIIDYECDECMSGQMLPTGMQLTVNPPRYPHVCNECGARQTFEKTYPYTEFKPENKQDDAG